MIVVRGALSFNLEFVKFLAELAQFAMHRRFTASVTLLVELVAVSMLDLREDSEYAILRQRIFALPLRNDSVKVKAFVCKGTFESGVFLVRGNLLAKVGVNLDFIHCSCLLSVLVIPSYDWFPFD